MQRKLRTSESIRRFWYRIQGEQPLLTTFWPQDYPRGGYHQIDDQPYRITRYCHAADYRFYEVWGHAVSAPAQSPEAGAVQVNEESAGASVAHREHVIA